MPEQPTIDPRLIEQTRQHIRQLVSEINQLAASDIPPQQFYGEFLQRVVQAVAAVGGAVWSREGQQPPRLQHQVNFMNSGLLDEAGSEGHSALLMNAFTTGQATLTPPHSGAGADADRSAGANHSDYALLIAPLQVDKHVVGMVELILDATRRQSALENAVRFVQELCDIGAGYLKNRQLRQMLGQQHLWSQLELFVRQIHSSLKPKEVAYIVANEGKRMVGCDRLSVALVYGRKAVIEGVSGQEVIERKSTLVQMMTRLCNAVMRSGEDLLFTGEQRDDLPPAVRDSLDDYLAESGTKVLAITILRAPKKEDGSPGEPLGTLLGEQLEDASSPASLTPRMEVVGQHAAIALDNALKHNRVFMLPVWAMVGNASEWTRGNRLVKLSIAVGLIAGITAAMLLIPLELKMKGKGTLVPEERRAVYAEEEGTVEKVLVEHGQLVDKGQLLVEMRGDQLQLQRNETEQLRKSAVARLRAALEASRQPGAELSPEVGVNITIAQSEIEIYTKSLELIDKRLQSMEVRSPISGMISTWELKRTLEGRPVKRGDNLLTVSNLSGNGEGASWLLEVKMPEDEIGHILEADSRRKEAGDQEPLKATFILASHPQRRFRGHVQRIATTAEFDQDLKEHVVMIRVLPDEVATVHTSVTTDSKDPEIKKVATVELELDDGTRLKISPKAEVSAKVHCGKRSMGYVLLRELIEFVYEKVIF